MTKVEVDGLVADFDFRMVGDSAFFSSPLTFSRARARLGRTADTFHAIVRRPFLAWRDQPHHPKGA
ncbi:hypothetical protein [Pandoraea sputorum]|uniref:hypothetical protein n=1 Tax=Pandoraea sputorum TaxID=93222 RepID=UPI00123EE8B8|nr:hypothetical protein [Pandoraea sputorum]